MIRAGVELEAPSRRLLLVRHGHYDRVGNQGDEVWELSAFGHKQAARTGRRLARIVDADSDRFAGIYSSPWPRAVQTAESTARELGLDRIHIKPYLHECTALVPRVPGPGYTLPPDMPPTSEQARRAATQQVARVRARFFQPAKKHASHLIFAHGNLIRYLVATTLGLPYESWTRLDCAHASITEIRIYPGGNEVLVTYASTSHLPPELVSS